MSSLAMLNLVGFLAGVVGLLVIGWQQWQLWLQDQAFLATNRTEQILHPPTKWLVQPKVTVLVAAWNESSNIEAHIQSFKQLRYPKKEMVLCVGGEDGSYDQAAQYASDDIRVLLQHFGEGKQKALHRSFNETTGDIIFLTDADCFLKDDAFEQTIYSIVMGQDTVCTGSSRPAFAQMAHPFIFSQATTQLYSAMHTAEYGAGLLGRNCALTRDVLINSDGLAAHAPTGTDYVLAKMIDRAGYAIRQQPHSQVVTAYPLTVGGYLRQQRRWLRNVALYGRFYHATNEMRASLITSLTGLVMLVLPLLALFVSPLLFVVWGLLLWQALLSRLRYLAFGSRVWKRPLRSADILWQIPLLFIDFFAWVQPLGDYLRPARRQDW